MWFILRSLGRCDSLEELRITECHGKSPPTSKSLKHLASNQSLRVLRLETSEVDSADLRYITRLRNLRTLGLGRLVLDDTAVAYLSQLPRLEQLGLNQQDKSAGFGPLICERQVMDNAGTALPSFPDE